MRINTAPVLALGLAVVIAAACSRRERMEAGSSESQSKAPEPTLSVKDVDLGRTINADKTGPSSRVIATATTAPTAVSILTR